MPPSRPHITIATPTQASANNGNWRTAQRWKKLLGASFRTIVHNAEATKSGALAATDLLIALHARRSAPLIQVFRRSNPDKPIVLVLTGTDLYRDLNESEAARAAVDTADALVVLQEDAMSHLPRSVRAKTHVVYQSAKPLVAARKSANRLNCVVVGHLRPEKSPETVFSAAHSLSAGSPIHILHIGSELSAALARRATHLGESNPQYRWCGSLSHGLTRAAIKRAHVLIHPSVIEGGANVIAEAITSGTPVIASYMSGNIGMLGRDYPGYFPVGDAEALARLLQRCLVDPAYFRALGTACRRRARLFEPQRERRTLLALMNAMLV